MAIKTNPSNPAGLVQKFANTSYDYIKTVYDNLTGIQEVADNIDAIVEIGTAGDLSDLAANITEVLANPPIGVKAPCVVSTTANITLSGTQTINTVAVVADDRVLVRSQTDPTENGIYVVAAGAWTRAVDWDEETDVLSGVLAIDAHTSALYKCSFTGTFAPGTSSVTFTFITAPTNLEDLDNADVASAADNNIIVFNSSSGNWELASTFAGNVTGNVTGDVTGNADTATALETARTIGGVSFDGLANINLPGVNATGNQDTTGNASTATNADTVTTNANLTGEITSVGNVASLGSFSSSTLATAITDETGSGAAVFATSPTLVTPVLGTPASGDLSNCTFPTLNQDTTGLATNAGHLETADGSGVYEEGDYYLDRANHTGVASGLTTIAINQITSSGDYVKPANLVSIDVIIIGGGGGGGDSGSGGSEAGGDGGLGGIAVINILDASINSPEVVTLGAGGAGGTGGGTGSTGGNSTFGVHATAYGGLGGTSYGAGAATGATGAASTTTEMLALALYNRTYGLGGAGGTGGLADGSAGSAGVCYVVEHY
jgi:hypothetical protein